MGEVYQARDTRLDRVVALKVLPEEFFEGEERRARFEREARLLASLNHPGIATLYSFEEISGRNVLTMELVGGKDLATRLASGPLPLEESLSLARQIAEALEAAHEKGIVHRDLKPANVVVSSEGKVKLLDFGLAKAFEIDAGSSPEISHSPTLTARATAAGVILGTAAYMSPEQARGKPVDKRADIWAFGVVLFEMLAGRRLFEGETVSDTLAAVLTKDPDFRLLPASAPAHVVQLLRRCLEKDPKKRLRDIGEARVALAGPASPEGLAEARPGPAKSSSRVARVAALVVGVAAAFAAGGWLLGRRGASGSADSVRFELKNYRYEAVFMARFLPDGQSLVYSAAPEGSTPEVFIVRPEFPDPRPVGLPDTHLLSVSPKGELAVLLKPHYVRHRFFVGTLARVPLAGGAPRALLDNVREADWGPDGESLAVVREVNGRDRLEYPAGKVLVEADGYLSDPRVSPDGNSVAFFRHTIRWDNRGVLEVIDRSGKKTFVSDAYSALEGIAWGADGREICFSGAVGPEDNLAFATTLSGRRRTLLRAPGPVTLFDVSREGRVLLSRESIHYGIRGRRAGEKQEKELGWLNSDQPRLSRDGERVFFMDDAPPWGDNYATGMRDLSSGPAVRLGEGVPIGPSPDGRWCVSMIPSAPGYLVLYPTGAGEPRKLESGGLENFSEFGSWFPDGKRILFSGSLPKGASRCWVQSVEGGPPAPVTPEGTRDCRVSPDASSVAARGEGDRWLLFPLSGGAGRPIPGVEASDQVIDFTSDGHAVLVLAGYGVPGHVERVDLATGKRSRLLDLSPPDRAGVLTIPDFAFAKEGAVYAYSYHEVRSQLFLATGLAR